MIIKKDWGNDPLVSTKPSELQSNQILDLGFNRLQRYKTLYLFCQYEEEYVRNSQSSNEFLKYLMTPEYKGIRWKEET